MIDRYRKVCNIIYAIGAVLVIIGAVMKILCVKIGVTGDFLIWATIFLVSMYQGWLISKLFGLSKNENNELTEKTENLL